MRHGKLHICRRKAGNSTTYPLAVAVGEALLAYLRNARPASPHREVFLSMLEADDEVTQAAVKLIENGYPDVTLVTPVGHEPGNPLPGRRSAA